MGTLGRLVHPYSYGLPASEVVNESSVPTSGVVNEKLKMVTKILSGRWLLYGAG